MINFRPIFCKKQIWLVVAIAILVLDLVTKSVTDGIVHQEAIPGLFSIESYHNTGASFSIFKDSKVMQILFIIFGILVCLVLLWYAFCSKNKNKNVLFYISAALLLGGILGNAIDRICLGYVRDFINLEFMTFAVFNVADSALCVGVVLFAIWLLFFSYKGEKEENGKKDF